MRESDRLATTAQRQPAAVLVIDLVAHSTKSRVEVVKIQRILENVFVNSLRTMDIPQGFARHTYTGDGYICVLIGQYSVMAVDFINIAFSELAVALGEYEQKFRAGFDFGILDLVPNALTGLLEHFDLPSIQAARLEKVGRPGQILATETARSIFHPIYPHVFSDQLLPIQTKDRIINAYEVYPVNYVEMRTLFSEYIRGIRTYDSDSTNKFPNGSRCIVIIDDEEDLLCELGMAIRGRFPDLNVVEYTSAEEALRSGSVSKAGLIITDIVMPGMNGLELCRKIVQDRISAT
jgi:CheY-like chemotaxis protein